MLNTKTITVGNDNYEVYESMNGYKFQELQRATIQLKKDKIDEVAYTNQLIKIFVKRLVKVSEDGKETKVDNIPDILEHILKQDATVLDTVTEAIEGIIENNELVKKNQG